LAALALAALVLAACGGDDDDTTAATTAAGGADVTTTLPAGEGEDDLCAIVTDATLATVLGGTPTYALPATPGAPKPTCTWGIEDGGTSVSVAMVVTTYPSEEEAIAALQGQVSDATFSPQPYEGLADQAIAVDQDTAKRVAARTGAQVVDITGLAVGRDLPAFDAMVAMAREATGNL
jgi:hypothetical protein